MVEKTNHFKTYLFNEPLAELGILGLLLLLLRQCKVELREGVRFPLRMLGDLGLLDGHHGFIRRHNYDWNLRLWHRLLRCTRNLMLQTKL